VLLVHLPFIELVSTQTPQLGLLYVASSLRQAGFETGVLDDPGLEAGSLLDYVRERRPRILGFHVNTDSLPRVRRAIGLLRANNLEPPLIIFGGPHVTIEDEPLLAEGLGSVVVRGEGEHAAVEIASWFIHGRGSLESSLGITYRGSDGRIQRNPDRPYVEDLDALPEPDTTMVLNKSDVRALEMITGRGCPFQCAFCAEGLSGIRYRFRSPESVLKEVRRLVGDQPRAYLGILDDTFLVDRKRVEAIARGLLKEFGPARLKWFCEGRADFIVKHKDLFPLLREAGLVRVQIGVESGSQEVLDSYRKGIRLADTEEAVAILRDADILSIYGNFIVGGALESPDTVRQSIELAKRLIALAPGRMECTASILGIFPGTAVTRDPARFGLKIIDPSMRRCVSLRHPVAVTARMSVNDILNAFHEFNREVALAEAEAVASIPSEVMRRQVELVFYGAKTHWADVFLRSSAIKTYHGMLSRKEHRSMRTIAPESLLSMVPHRTGGILEVEDGALAVKAHPRKILFNEMAGAIYELCAGKLSVAEIVGVLRETRDFLPPEPALTQHVVDVLHDMDEQFLLVFSDL
jgi:radical SAM superfamily enzyme YgiQ (UPF0313 family)